MRGGKRKKGHESKGNQTNSVHFIYPCTLKMLRSFFSVKLFGLFVCVCMGEEIKTEMESTVIKQITTITITVINNNNKQQQQQPPPTTTTITVEYC